MKGKRLGFSPVILRSRGSVILRSRGSVILRSRDSAILRSRGSAILKILFDVYTFVILSLYEG